MMRIFRLLLAGWLAKKMGARAGVGCLGVIVLFIILLMAIGYLLNQGRL